MQQHQRKIRNLLAAAMLCACICLTLGDAGRSLTAFFMPAAIFLETGRFPTPVFSVPETEPPTEPAESLPPEQMSGTTLTAQDGDYIEMLYRCDYRPDIEPLLLQPLRWDLTEGSPSVLILHTHATECYTDAPSPQHDPYRTLDREYNMVAMGAELARLLERGGIGVIHDTDYHDYPDYNSSYVNARETIAAYLEKYPTIRMVLDLHRDASDTTAGQLVTSATVGGQRSAQLLVMVGTDATGNYHPNWRENLALGLKLTAVLERSDPGICRPVTLRQERFNMDQTAGSLLIEVGAAGNTQQEARLAVHALARGILELAHGANLS